MSEEIIDLTHVTGELGNLLCYYQILASINLCSINYAAEKCKMLDGELCDVNKPFSAAPDKEKQNGGNVQKAKKSVLSRGTITIPLN